VVAFCYQNTFREIEGCGLPAWIVRRKNFSFFIQCDQVFVCNECCTVATFKSCPEHFRPGSSIEPAFPLAFAMIALPL
jgi:hypothetical protein